MSELELVHTGVDFGEGPRWHDGRLWFSDLYRHAVFSLGDDGERLEVELDDQPSGLGWMPDGTLLVVAMTTQRLLAIDDAGQIREHADLSSIATDLCNDMVVSADGHAYVGNFGYDFMAGADVSPAYLAHVTPDGGVRRVDHPLRFPNGSVITADGSTLIVGETQGARYTAFTIDADGHPIDPYVWVAIEGGTPDGCCLDAEGAIWMSDVRNDRFIRIHRDGTISREFRVDDHAIACMLGGPEDRTLFCFVAPSALPGDAAGNGLARIYAVDVDVPRAGLP